MCEKKELIILTGPTAVGKTALSIRLAKSLDGEIISADSMQVYKHMDIGSAKITRQEMGGIPHHLIDVLEPWEEFNVARFKEMAVEAMDGIYRRGHIPVVVGGTGFYIQALLYDIDFSLEDGGGKVRERLLAEAREKGKGHLYERLRQVDPDSALSIHPNNLKRIIRALEFYELNGTTISGHNRREREKGAAYRSRYFVLDDERDEIYRKIDARVEDMLSRGLVDEVRELKEMGCHKGMVSMQGLGYKETLQYLEGECTLEDAVNRIKRDTRHFAKRQLTWFRRERDVIWVEKGDFGHDEGKMLDHMLKLWEGEG